MRDKQTKGENIMKLVALVKMIETTTLMSDFPEAYRECEDVRKCEITDEMYNKYWEAREAYIDALRQIELEWLRSK